MSKVYRVPLIAHAQTLTVQLAGTAYLLRVVWNLFAQAWVIDIATQGGTPIVQGIPLVTGIDLLAQYEYLGIKGGLIAQTGAPSLLPPTFDNLGSESNLYFVVP